MKTPATLTSLLMQSPILSNSIIKPWRLQVVNEKNCFQQTRGMPVAAAVEATLLNSANGADGQIPQEIKLY